MKRPPADPAVATSKTPPVISVTVILSPISASLSAPLPLSSSTLPATIAESSSVAKASPAALGSSLAPAMVTVTVTLSVPPLPSLMV